MGRSRLIPLLSNLKKQPENVTTIVNYDPKGASHKCKPRPNMKVGYK